MKITITFLNGKTAHYDNVTEITNSLVKSNRLSELLDSGVANLKMPDGYTAIIKTDSIKKYSIEL